MSIALRILCEPDSAPIHISAQPARLSAATVVEVIEHLDEARLAANERVLFEAARPRTVVITTPNAEYNVKFGTLPAGQFSSLMLMATGVNGNQSSETLTVTYTDGTTSQFTQNFSDWFTPQKYPGELEGVAMAYRNFDNGTKDQRTFNLYAYRFALNSTKTVASLTLPNDQSVAVLAATLVP